MNKILLSVSGGRTSWMMAKWMKDNVEAELIYVFANTGKEREETLVFNQRCSELFGIDLVWIEAVTNHENGKGVTAKVVDYETASRNGEPFEAMIAKHGIPNSATPHCTRELKAYAIRAYAKSIGWKNYHTAIGIRADEQTRLNWTKAKKEKLLYPLANMRPTNKSDVAIFWKSQPFDLGLKSYEGNCDLCWKKSRRKLLTMLKENPKMSEWWQEMERKYENYLPESRQHNDKIKPPFRFYRSDTSISELLEDTSYPFDLAVDESKDYDRRKQAALWDLELDSNMGCVESCEVF